MTSTISCPTCNYRWMVMGTIEEKRARSLDWQTHECAQARAGRKPTWKKPHKTGTTTTSSGA